MTFLNEPRSTNPLADDTTCYRASRRDDGVLGPAFSSRAAAAYEVRRPSAPQLFTGLPSPVDRQQEPVDPVVLGATVVFVAIALSALIGGALLISLFAAPYLAT